MTAKDTAARLPTLDRFLPVWIGVAMAGGLLLGRLIPGLGSALSAVEVQGISLPIAIGLLVMMYPVLAKVRYDRLDEVATNRRLMVSSLLLNWVVGPAVMFALAWLLLPDLPEYRTGLIIVGLARCIAMVIIWNDLACGDREAAAVLVALNSLFQVVMFAALGWFYLSVLPGWLGLPRAGIEVSPWQIAKSVLVFLGIPLLAGFLSRRLGERAKGRAWFESTFLPHVGPWALYGLLFTIVILFALQGREITSRPWDVARIAVPLLAYFAIMWAGGYALGYALRLGYARTTTLAFTAAGNNFELAIAVAIATYGVTSGQALAGVVGPLIEVPVLLGLVYLALSLRAGPLTHKPSVLFVCVHNAGRSQMAAALLSHLAGDRIEVRSAGTEPADQLNPAAVAAMAEIGIDLTAARPKLLTGDAVETSDVVITMGCGDTCPFFPGVSYRDWRLPDPAGQPLSTVRAIRDDIAERVQTLVSELLAPAP
ncbi:arsenic-transport integral membrane protein ArsC [Mycobacterium saskatchewanense]|uniref:ArsC family transcriptional regulator n=1 Tax=Mycobacterium saskatchewanense TaxID=220927 RepID=A0AAJ3TXG1_9MYCO|nr:ACR3 family arsenite efflux transporter [Mycobacterium saskatchewanense]ORW72437.1 ArsC family transcriptional regulator [Mycobacterium saskatchewanense]BBX63869.1 arsenic-transport integral membrane protein ArsC [Mycobacterium saskatchewanense]